MRTTGDATCSPQHVVSKCVAVGGVKWNPSFQDSSAPGWAGAAVGGGHIRQDDLPSHWWVSTPRPGSLCVCLHMQERSRIYGGSCIPRPGCACCAKECTLCKGMHAAQRHARAWTCARGCPIPRIPRARVDLQVLVSVVSPHCCGRPSVHRYYGNRRQSQACLQRA